MIIQMKSAKELFSQVKSVLVVKSATYTHLVKVKTSDFFVEILPTFSLNISLNRSTCEKSFGLFEVTVYITFLTGSYFSINFHDKFLRVSSSKMVNP